MTEHGSETIMNYDALRALIFELTAPEGPAGKEASAAKVAKEKLELYMPVTIDRMGSVRGELPGDGPHILLDAHIDQISMLVTAVDANGFIKFDKCGGIDRRILAAHEVTVWGKQPLFGVVSSTPPHLVKKEEANKVPAFEDMAIDVGLSKDKARELIRPGDRITLRGKSLPLLDNRICGPALDDRAGVASILRCLELLSEKKHRCRLSVLFSVQEETGGSGAKTAGFCASAPEGIAVDVSFAMAPGHCREKCADLGKGTMIGISPTLDESVSARLQDIAQRNDIAYQLEVMGGRTGTNADELQVSCAGTKCGLLSIPLRNMHSGIELIDLGDVESTAQLMAAYILERSEDHD